MQTYIETPPPASPTSVADEQRMAAHRLGWQCGYAYAGFYPTSTQDQHQQAAQRDAMTLIHAPEARPLFVEAWMKGVQAALAVIQRVHVGVCPCCGQEDVLLSDVTLIVGLVDSAGRIKLAPQRLCFPCAELDPEHRFTRSLSRPVQPTSVPQMVLSLLVRKDYPTHLVAEQVASHFPFLTDSVVMHAVEGQVAVLVAQITPVQFNWINRLIAQGHILAVGVSLVSPAVSDRCACGHLLRSPIEHQRGWGLECGLVTSYSQKGYTK